MADDRVITVGNVSKAFKLPHEKHTSVKSALINFGHSKKGYEKQKVLDYVSFEIKKGEFFGIVGRNGSGKSTLLKLLAGIYSPDKGSIQINGKLTPFIELGVGFNPELSGRENVFLNGALLGFSRKEMETMYDDIVAFAELERFMDQKLKNYSSGMQVRLAFSIAIQAKSDILLIDEVLAVGDAAFQAKCFDYFSQLKQQGATVVFVSHDRASLERFCDRGILINDGKLVKQGGIKQVLKEYGKIVLHELERTSVSQQGAITTGKISSEYAKISQTCTNNAAGKTQKEFAFGESITVSFRIHVLRKIYNPIVGVTIWRKGLDKPIYASNTVMEKKKTSIYEKGDHIIFQAELPVLLNDGEYYIEPAIANDSGTVFYDLQPQAASFWINGSSNPISLLAATNSISVGKVK